MSATLYKCDQCGRTFNSIDGLENHRRNEHIKPAPPT
ncbi:MAG: C2H2-type zinc finger protein [Nitrososphaerales archaeon]